MAITPTEGKHNRRVAVKLFLMNVTVYSSRLEGELLKASYIAILWRKSLNAFWDKAKRADAAFEDCGDHDRMRYRNWLSSINSDSGAWLSATDDRQKHYFRCMTLAFHLGSNENIHIFN